MQIEITPESVLKQLKISVTPSNLSQMEAVFEHTSGYDHFFKHLFALNDALAHLNAFIAPSSTQNNLKIKFHGGNEAQLETFHETVTHWAAKYKVALEKVPAKETYYIKGLAPLPSTH